MTTSSATFAPDWASPPGESIRDALDERGVAAHDFASSIGLSGDEFNLLLGGATPITMSLASVLSAEIGASPEFWVNRDCQYRDDLERRSLFEWLGTLPIKDMIKFGWIPDSRERLNLAHNCLAFFDAPDLAGWSEQRGLGDAVSFRSSATFEGTTNAVEVWLHEVRRQASLIEVAEWNLQSFEASLDTIRKLTRDKNPESFVPKLQRLCAASGVRNVVVRAPSGCTASGAALFLDDQGPVIALSARHLSDDHFWYTFFHEAGHLVLHGSSTLHIDAFDGPTPPDVADDEAEADDFARIRLVPSDALAGLPTHRKPQAKEIIRLAVRAKVAPGVVVGQLQYGDGPLGYNNLNHLKRRYKWNGLNLEMA